MQNEPETGAGRRTLLLLVTGVLLLAFGWILTGESLQAESEQQASVEAGTSDAEGEVLAVVAGDAITRAEVEVEAGDKLQELEVQRMQFERKLENDRYQALKEGLDRLMDERLLELEAEERGVEVDALVASEIDSKIEPVTDERIASFYSELQSQGRRLPPKEQIEGQIRQHLEQQTSTEAREAFVAQLRDKYQVKIELDAPTIDVAAEGFPSHGPEDAPVTLVEFSDFECPFCSRIVPAIDKVKENYSDQVRVVFRQFPLRNMHPHAQKAAEASLCAWEQGKFWEMHDLMFEEQEKLAVSDLKEKAGRLELDTGEFDRCLESGKYQSEVQADVMAGVEAGVSGTPAVFINGRFLSGAQPYPALAEIIDEELAKAGED